MDLKEMQKKVYENKIKHGFNVTDVPMEFCYLYGEVSEAYDAYHKNKEDLGSELADVAIYLMGLSEILGFDLHDEIVKKMEINRKRKYVKKGNTYERIENAEEL